MLTSGDLATGFKAEAAQGPMGWPQQGHGRLPRRAVALADIAGQTGCGDVFPGIEATAAAGHHMVDRELLSAGTAVLAAMAIAVKQVARVRGNGL